MKSNLSFFFACPSHAQQCLLRCRLQRESLGSAPAGSPAATPQLLAPPPDAQERWPESSSQQQDQHAHPGGRRAQGSATSASIERWHIRLFLCISFNRVLVSQLLHLSIKKSKVTSSEESTLEMLDPFISLLLDCLDSMHVKVGACTLISHDPILEHQQITCPPR